MVKIDARPTFAVKNSALPFNRTVPMAIEPTNHLPNPFVSELVREREPARDLVKPLLSEPAREIDPLNVLKSTKWSAVLDDTVTDPITVLNSEICSVRLEAVVSEAVMVLRIEECSRRTEDKPSDPDRVRGKVLVSEPATDSELVIVLRSET